MPTYQNNNSTEAVLGSERIAPGQTVETIRIYETSELPANVVKILDTPVWNPIFESVKLTNGGTVNVPFTDENGNDIRRYLIHIHVASGEPEIAYNLGSVAKKLVGYPDMRWNIRVGNERILDKVVITGTSVVYVTVESI